MDTFNKRTIRNHQINNRNNNVDYKDYIYFHHLRTSGISSKQAKKIKKYLGIEKYNILLKYHQTCVFTNNIFEANDFDVAFNEFKKAHTE